MDGKQIWLPELLKDFGWVASTSEGKRMVLQGAVRLNEVVIKEERYNPTDRTPLIIQCGKRKFAKIVWKTA